MNRYTLAAAVMIFACDQVNAPPVDEPCPGDAACHAQGGVPRDPTSGAGAGGDGASSGGAAAGGDGTFSGGASATAGSGAGAPDCPEGVCSGAAGGGESAGAGPGGSPAGGSSEGGASAGASPTATGGAVSAGAGGASGAGKAGGAGDSGGTAGNANCKPGDTEVALVCFPPSSDTSYPFMMSGLRFKYPNTSGVHRSLSVAAINNHGVMIGTRTTCQVSHAFSYADGVFTQLSDEASGADAINDNGTIVGVSGGETVMWRNGETIRLPPGRAIAVNEHDQVLLLNGQHGSLWKNGVTTSIGEKAYASDLNDAGEVVGVDFNATPSRAFLWKDGVFYDLPPLDGDRDSRAEAINNQGQVVGESEDHPVIWENGIPRLLSPEPIDSEMSLGSAMDINTAGSVVGITRVPGELQGYGTFLYSSGAFTRVGSVFDNLRINDNEVIVGTSYIWSRSCYDICCNAAARQ